MLLHVYRSEQLWFVRWRESGEWSLGKVAAFELGQILAMRFQISGLEDTHTRPSKQDRSTARRVWQRKGWEHETIGKRSENVAIFCWDTKHVVVLWIPPLFLSILSMPNISPPRCSAAVYPSSHRIIAYQDLAVEEDLCFVRYVDLWTPPDGYVEPRLWPCSRLQFLDLAQSPSVNHSHVRRQHPFEYTHTGRSLRATSGKLTRWLWNRQELDERLLSSIRTLTPLPQRVIPILTTGR